jgi:hypothetical protein
MTGNLDFDRETLRLLISELGTEDTAEVLRAFLDDTRNKIQVLRAVPPDPVLIRREAHSIKSSAGTFGFAALSGLAFGVEQNALRMSPAELESAAAELSVVFEATAEFARSSLLASNMEIA